MTSFLGERLLTAQQLVAKNNSAFPLTPTTRSQSTRLLLSSMLGLFDAHNRDQPFNCASLMLLCIDSAAVEGDNFFLVVVPQLWQAQVPMPERIPNIEQRSDEQLLQMLLRSDKRAAAIDSEFTIVKIVNANRRELRLTQAAYDRLMAGIELGRRVQEAKARYDLPNIISSSNCAIEFCRIHFARLISDSLQEQFHIVTLNTKNHVIDTHQITVGTLDASLVHPREVFRPAVRDAASSIILAHNHSSGDPTPSKEDFTVTKRLEEAGQLVGINVLDHIVLGKNGVVSIREHRAN